MTIGELLGGGAGATDASTLDQYEKKIVRALWDAGIRTVRDLAVMGMKYAEDARQMGPLTSGILRQALVSKELTIGSDPADVTVATMLYRDAGEVPIQRIWEPTSGQTEHLTVSDAANMPPWLRKIIDRQRRGEPTGPQSPADRVRAEALGYVRDFNAAKKRMESSN